MERSFLIGLVLAILIASSFLIFAYQEISSGKYRGDDYYVSDEVWYATSSRNLLQDVFGYDPEYIRDGYAYATLVFTSTDFLESHIGEIEECLRSLGGEVVRSNYTTTGDKVPLLWVKVPEGNLSRLKKGCDGSIKVRTGFEYPSKSNIYNYMNWEHPPLGKYLIMLSMVLLGDEPMSWRIPGLIEAFLMIILVYLAGSKLLNPLWGVVASLSLALDPMFRAMSMVAMLDIHLAFFTTLALLLIIYDKPFVSSVVAWLAFSVKFSGLFVVLAVYLYLRIYKRERVLPSLAKSLVPAIVYLLVSLPLILHLGLSGWIQENLNAISWHTTSRGSGPVPSPPWGWFFNVAPMALHYNPDLIARVNLITYSAAFLFTILLLPALIERRRGYIPMLFISSIVLGYTGIFLKGNRTLYSFYAVQLSPAVALAFAVSLCYMTVGEEDLSKYLEVEWKRILKALMGVGRIPLPEELSFLRPFLEMDPRSLALSLAALVATFSSLILYYLAFMPSSPAAILGLDDVGLSNVLNVYLGQISEDIWVKGIVFGSIIMVSALIVVLDVREFNWEMAYLPILALLFLSGSDWVMLSIALALDGVLFAMRGRSLAGFFLIGIASTLNPLSLALAVPTLKEGRRRDLLGLAVIAPFLAIEEFVHWPGNVVGGVLRPVIGDNSIIVGALAALATIVLTMKGDRFGSSAIAMGMFLFLSGGRPSWTLIPLIMMSAAGSSVGASILELLAIIPVLSWATPGMLSGPLFKCSPEGLRDPCSDPFISLTLFSLLLIYWGIRRIASEQLSGDSDHDRYSPDEEDSPASIGEV